MNKKILGAAVLALTFALALSGCGAAPDRDGIWGDVDMNFPGASDGYDYWTPGGEAAGDAAAPDAPDGETGPNYQYSGIVEQGFKDTAEEAASYFSLDRNTANYAYVRAQLNNDLTVASDSVRIEELLNYFTYDGYTMPADGEEVAVSGYLSDCPWNDAHKLATFGIRTAAREIEAEYNNYTFLVDVSGSMSATVRGTKYTCLGLVKYGIEQLVAGMGDSDRVAIVTYASGVGVKLEPTLATEEGKKEILSAVGSLNASGSTNGSEGLALAYEQAEKYKVADGNNRVILLTDGDFNMGIYDTSGLETFICEKAESGVYLSVIGVGLGNTRDDIMETLALAGNGNYAYIDSELEAQKVLSEELAGTLIPVAKDAKAGVTFDPELVASYRMIGYDMKTMSEDEFYDPNKDAGEIGSNLCVTVMYEIVLTENDGSMSESSLLATAEVRYKSVEEDEAEKFVTAEVTLESPSGNDQIFAACVAEFGLILRQSEYKGTASLSAILARLTELNDYLAADVYKAEFKTLVEKAAVSEKYE